MDISGNININKKKFGKYDPQNRLDKLLFGKKKLFIKKNQNNQKYEELAGINELDSNIINSRSLPATPVMIEMQLGNAEKKLEKINDELKNDKKLGIFNAETYRKLCLAKYRAKTEVYTYRKQYREQGITYKITDSISQAKNVVFQGYGVAKEKLQNSKLLEKLLSKLPSYKERQKAEIARLLNTKLEHEMSRPVKADSKNIEILFSKADKLIPPRQTIN